MVKAIYRDQHVKVPEGADSEANASDQHEDSHEYGLALAGRDLAYSHDDATAKE